MEQNSANVLLQKEVRRIDRWVAYVANHVWVRSLVFVVAFLEGIISPLPPEVVVAAVLSYRKDISWKFLSLLSAIGSAGGLAVLYVMGKYAYATHEIFFNNLIGGSSISAYTQSLFSHNTFISMFLSTFTPLLDRVFALLAGVLSLSFPVVIFAFFCGRLIRIGIVAFFSHRFGSEARQYIMKHTKMATIIVILLAILYIALNTSGIL